MLLTFQSPNASATTTTAAAVAFAAVRVTSLPGMHRCLFQQDVRASVSLPTSCAKAARSRRIDGFGWRRQAARLEA